MPFDLSRRDGPELISELSRRVQTDPLFQAVMETVDGYLMVLNPQRQILAANRQFLNDFRIDEQAAIAGQRPGEVLRCIHACESPDGCGASPACASCGAAGSILAARSEGTPCVGECLATFQKNGTQHAREFRVRTTPLRIKGDEFTVMILNDISGDKRREALERTFFHDVLNTLGGLMGWCNLLQEVGGPDTQRVINRISFLTMRLKDEIEDHRRLTEAERGTLSVNRADHSVAEVLRATAAIFEAHEVARGRRLVVDEPPAGEAVNTDLNLLLRVLGNMVKNALEAVPEGVVVRMWFAREGSAAVFRVHNPGAIDPAMAPRVFERSYSTKPERGRGLGTYSMRLFGERYLGGKVGFESSAEAGTTFFIRI